MMITGCLGLFVLFFCIILLLDQENNCSTLFLIKNLFLWSPQEYIFSLKLFYNFETPYMQPMQRIYFEYLHKIWGTSNARNIFQQIRIS